MRYLRFVLPVCRPRLIGIVALLLVSQVLGAQDNAQTDLVADFVWSEEFAGGSRILHSRYVDGAWRSPQTVFEDASLNILPSVAAVGQDDMVVVWSTLKSSGIYLRYSRFSKQQDSTRWSEAAVLADKNPVNLAPVLLAVDGGYRVFWSAHDSADDDIFSSRLTAAGWLDPFMIHAENTAIDILPQAGFDQDGRIWVTWEAIDDVAVEQPVVLFELPASSLAGSSSIAPDLESLRKQSESLFDLQPPVFFSSKSRATLYFQGITSHPIRLFPGNLLP